MSPGEGQRPADATTRPDGVDGSTRPDGVDGSTRPDGADGSTPEDVADLAADLRRVLLVSSRVLRARTASDDVSASQYSVLAYLQRTGPSTPGVLADFEHVSPPVMTRLLGRLEAAGYVDRVAHPGDGRQVQVTLTEAGEEVVVRGRAERDAWLRSRLETAGPAQQESLRAATELLRRTLFPPPG